MAKEYIQNLDKVIKIDEGKIQDHLGEMVRGTVDIASKYIRMCFWIKFVAYTWAYPKCWINEIKI